MSMYHRATRRHFLKFATVSGIATCIVVGSSNRGNTAFSNNAVRKTQMKLIVLHNENGDILSLAVPTNKFSKQLSIQPENHQFVTEIYTSEEKNMTEFAANIVENFQVIQGKLVRKGNKNT